MVGFFLASIDIILFFKVATKESKDFILFYSSRWRRRNFPFTPHQTLLSGVTEVFLHNGCISHQNSISKSEQVCVCVRVCNVSINEKLHFFLCIAGGASSPSSLAGEISWGRLADVPACLCYRRRYNVEENDVFTYRVSLHLGWGGVGWGNKVSERYFMQ